MPNTGAQSQETAESDNDTQIHRYVNYALVALLGIILLTVAFLLGINTAAPGQTPEVVQNVVEREKVYLSNSPAIRVKNADIPAVSSEQKGVLGSITVSVEEGQGNIFLNIANILVKEDAAHSLRKAAEIAYNLTNVSMDSYDTSYFVTINSPAIEGSSAGAMATALTYAAITDQNVNKDVTITGTIHYDGTIGPASGVLEKARAAAQAGKEMILVPPHQAIERNVTRSEACRNYGDEEFCNEEVSSQRISIEEQADIRVKEVETIREVLDYLLTNRPQ